MTVSGRTIYLPGPFNSIESKAGYARVIAEWNAAGKQAPAKSKDISITELAARYWKHVEVYYKSSSEPYAIQSAIRELRKLYGRTAASGQSSSGESLQTDFD
ncbi:MAG: hypothetical protein IPK83_19695 [Planctomycetes bacterium]|nr:hypothetical protein [Planctomycetota bacterium]